MQHRMVNIWWVVLIYTLKTYWASGIFGIIMNMYMLYFSALSIISTAPVVDIYCSKPTLVNPNRGASILQPTKRFSMYNLMNIRVIKMYLNVM